MILSLVTMFLQNSNFSLLILSHLSAIPQSMFRQLYFLAAKQCWHVTFFVALKSGQCHLTSIKGRAEYWL